jgi:peptidyl-prolyl cis-trans isomerase C
MLKALVATLLLTTASYAQTDKVVAKVNGVEIKESDMLAAESEIGQNAQSLPEAQKREFVLNFLIDMQLAAKAAEGKGLDKTPDFIKKMADAKKKLLVETMLENDSKMKVSDAAIKQVYEDELKKLKPEEEVSARHILVPTEDEAKAIMVKLKAGGDFAALAKELSKDTGSGAEGGSLGYFTKGKMVPEFEKAAFEGKKGDLLDPVKSQFGWHIIKVEDKRSQEPPKLEQVKPQIEEYLIRKAQSDMITALRASAKIEKIGEKPADKPAEKPAEKK